MSHGVIVMTQSEQPRDRFCATRATRAGSDVLPSRMELDERQVHQIMHRLTICDVFWHFANSLSMKYVTMRDVMSGLL